MDCNSHHMVNKDKEDPSRLFVGSTPAQICVFINQEYFEDLLRHKTGEYDIERKSKPSEKIWKSKEH